MRAAVIPPRYMPLDPRATGKAFSRASAVQPGSPFTRRFFAEHPMVLQVGSTIFVHGGLHPEHVHVGVDKLNQMSQACSPPPSLIPYFSLEHIWTITPLPNYSCASHSLARLPQPALLYGHAYASGAALVVNVMQRVKAVQDWMEGKPMEKPWFLRGRDAVVWSRSYSHPEERACNCDMLQQTLEDVGARRMVVGHTIQAAGINGACDNQVLRCCLPLSAPCSYRRQWCRLCTWGRALSMHV